jgi:hypothetical protein
MELYRFNHFCTDKLSDDGIKKPLCFKAFKLMLKYYNRLIKIEQSKEYVYDLLRSAFEEDNQLHSQNCLS